jgi:hypothetical protein
MTDLEGLRWIEDCWQLDGRDIHTGDPVKMQFPDGIWIGGRIEFTGRGQTLLFYFDFHGMDFSCHVDTRRAPQCQLCWPTA